MKQVKKMIVAAAFCASVVALGNDAKVIRLSDFVKEIDGRNLVALPIGAVLAVDGANAALSGKEGVSKVAVPDNQSERAAADCAALCVSEIFVDNKTMEIKGGLGSNVYPTVAEGVFAMTNRIVASVMKVSKGTASVTRLAMDKEKGCGEVKFFWERKTGGISELIVRGYVNVRRQMAVCTLLHTKGDGISAEMNFHKLP